MEEHLDLRGKCAQQVVWHQIEGSLHPLLPILAQLLVLDTVWIVDVVEHPVDADLDLPEKLRRPDLLYVEAKIDLSRARVVCLHGWRLLVVVVECDLWHLLTDFGLGYLLVVRFLLLHEPME